MKKILIFIVTVLFLSSCEKQLRIEQKETAEQTAYETTPYFLLSGTISDVASYYQDLGFKGHGYPDVMRYYQNLFKSSYQNFSIFEISEDDWDEPYEKLRRIKASIEVSEEAGKPAYAACQQILKVFMFSYITDTYGDVPYSEALRGREGIVKPVYDLQKDVYDGMLATLDEAAATLESTSDVIDEPKFDLMYAGDKSKWAKFAYTLKLRLLVRSYEAYKKAGINKGDDITALASKVMSSNADNAAIDYIGDLPATSWPLSYNDNNSGGDWTRRKVGEPFLEKLKELNDPRIAGWISPAEKPWMVTPDTTVFTDIYGYEYTIYGVDVNDAAAGLIVDYPLGERYVGAPHSGDLKKLYDDEAASGDYDNFKLSHFGQIFRENSHPLLRATMIAADEAQFCLAEAAAKGWISGSAATYYQKGIELNMDRWGIPTTDADAYVASVALDGTTDLDKIATQKYFALFSMAVESYFDFRRTNAPAWVANGITSQTIGHTFPYRYRYVTSEKDNNAENVDAAIARQGTDDQYTKMWLLK